MGSEEDTHFVPPTVVLDYGGVAEYEWLAQRGLQTLSKVSLLKSAELPTGEIGDVPLVTSLLLVLLGEKQFAWDAYRKLVRKKPLKVIKDMIDLDPAAISTELVAQVRTIMNLPGVHDVKTTMTQMTSDSNNGKDRTLGWGALYAILRWIELVLQSRAEMEAVIQKEEAEKREARERAKEKANEAARAANARLNEKNRSGTLKYEVSSDKLKVKSDNEEDPAHPGTGLPPMPDTDEAPVPPEQQNRKSDPVDEVTDAMVTIMGDFSHLPMSNPDVSAIAADETVVPEGSGMFEFSGMSMGSDVPLKRRVIFSPLSSEVEDYRMTVDEKLFAGMATSPFDLKKRPATASNKAEAEKIAKAIISAQVKKQAEFDSHNRENRIKMLERHIAQRKKDEEQLRKMNDEYHRIREQKEEYERQYAMQMAEVKALEDSGKNVTGFIRKQRLEAVQIAMEQQRQKLQESGNEMRKRRIQNQKEYEKLLEEERRIAKEKVDVLHKQREEFLARQAHTTAKKKAKLGAGKALEAQMKKEEEERRKALRQRSRELNQQRQEALARSLAESRARKELETQLAKEKMSEIKQVGRRINTERVEGVKQYVAIKKEEAKEHAEKLRERQNQIKRHKQEIVNDTKALLADEAKVIKELRHRLHTQAYQKAKAVREKEKEFLERKYREIEVTREKNKKRFEEFVSEQEEIARRALEESTKLKDVEKQLAEEAEKAAEAYEQSWNQLYQTRQKGLQFTLSHVRDEVYREYYDIFSREHEIADRNQTI